MKGKTRCVVLMDRRFWDKWQKLHEVAKMKGEVIDDAEKMIKVVKWKDSLAIREKVISGGTREEAFITSTIQRAFSVICSENEFKRHYLLSLVIGCRRYVQSVSLLCLSLSLSVLYVVILMLRTKNLWNKTDVRNVPWLVSCTEKEEPTSLKFNWQSQSVSTSIMHSHRFSRKRILAFVFSETQDDADKEEHTKKKFKELRYITFFGRDAIIWSLLWIRHHDHPFINSKRRLLSRTFLSE